MADDKPTRPAKQAAPEPPPPPVLAPAGESTNPLVHQLLAQREIYDRNGDTDAVKAVDAQLAEFGVK